MENALDFYLQTYIHRYDKDGIVPYLSVGDFPGLCRIESEYRNSIGIRISSFTYFYDSKQKGPVLLFLPGMGPGHTAYIREIELFCRAGYTVKTLDYCGCGESDGDSLISFNEPTRDAIDLIAKEQLNVSSLLLAGHSMGGYTAYNLMSLFPAIPRAIVLSGFYSMDVEIQSFGDLSLIHEYEHAYCAPYDQIDNFETLSHTGSRFLIIHSEDDPIVPYEQSSGYLQKAIQNPNLQYITVNGRRHNPNYSDSAVQYMTDAFTEYTRKVHSKELASMEDRKAFMQSKSAMRMTDPDERIRDVMLSFLKDASFSIHSDRQGD